MDTSNKRSSNVSRATAILGKDIRENDVILGRGTGPNRRYSNACSKSHFSIIADIAFVLQKCILETFVSEMK